MCDFDEQVYTCGHSTFRLKSYCHRTRNDPYKECHFVKKLRDVWDQSWPCDDCKTPAQKAAAAEEAKAMANARVEKAAAAERAAAEAQQAQQGDHEMSG